MEDICVYTCSVCNANTNKGNKKLNKGIRKKEKKPKGFLLHLDQLSGFRYVKTTFGVRGGFFEIER